MSYFRKNIARYFMILLYLLISNFNLLSKDYKDRISPDETNKLPRIILFDPQSGMQDSMILISAASFLRRTNVRVRIEEKKQEKNVATSEDIDSLINQINNSVNKIYGVVNSRIKPLESYVEQSQDLQMKLSEYRRENIIRGRKLSIIWFLISIVMWILSKVYNWAKMENLSIFFILFSIALYIISYLII